MRRLTVATVSVAASLALAACAERDTTSPRQITANEASRNLVGANWPACDATFNAIKTAAGNFFSSKKDPAYDLIAGMAKDYKVSQTQATSKGLDILARVAAARLTSDQASGSDGGPLVVAVIACTDLRNTGPGLFDPSAALARGIFEIRGATSTNAALAYSGTRDVTGANVYQGGAVPLWGVEGTWAPTPARYLVYGYPRGPGADVRDTAGFELGKLPTNVDVSGLYVGVCSSAVNANLSSANLLDHADGTEVLLTHNTAFCAGHMTANAARMNPLMQRLVQLITPKVAIAQGRDDEFIGGLPSGWSPFRIKHFANTGVGLTFSLQPENKNVYTLDTVQVTVSSAAAPVVVTLTIAGNNGDPTTLVIQDGAGNWIPKPFLTATTNSLGVATFIYGYSKAGGYTLLATGSIGGTFVSTQSKISDLFQIKNK